MPNSSCSRIFHVSTWLNGSCLLDFTLKSPCCPDFFHWSLLELIFFIFHPPVGSLISESLSKIFISLFSSFLIFCLFWTPSFFVACAGHELLGSSDLFASASYSWVYVAPGFIILMLITWAQQKSLWMHSMMLGDMSLWTTCVASLTLKFPPRTAVVM